jgi:putative salt-induced outer membrane protein YdiY
MTLPAAVCLALSAITALAETESPRWLSELDFSVGGSSGNSRTLDLRTAFRTDRDEERRRLRFDASYFYSESEGEQNQGRLSAGARSDWSIEASRWLYFLQLRYDLDEFRAWTHRASTHGGMGYHFSRREDLKLIGRLGAGASKEWDATEDVQPEGVLGFEADWRISERQRLTAESTLFPTLDDVPEFRWVSTVAWRTQLDGMRGISLSLGVENEYESETPPGIRNNDLTYFVGLTLAF